ncbi:MAG: hypothetical protein GXY79_12095, partial [Chloroflexi bacterium]|nr:hypothetical protein [Chloroflexota bacterium]
AYPEVTLRRGQLPESFERYLDGIEQEERANLEQEMESLNTALTSGREAIDARMALAQHTVGELREKNPELNQREERLKRRIVRLQDEFSDAFEEIEALSKPFLGSLTNMFAIHKLRRRQKKLKKDQQESVEALRKVRAAWVRKVQDAGDRQSELRQAWQEQAIETLQQQSRYDHVRNNLEALARQNGLQRALEEMTEAPELDDELGSTLAELAEHNQVRARFEEALEAVSTSVGLLNGMEKGLNTFTQSVASVLEEQKEYGLKQIRVEVPARVVAVNTTWNALTARVKDEGSALRDPLAFAAVARQYVVDRVTPEEIQRYFESMGDALNRATAEWN